MGYIVFLCEQQPFHSGLSAFILTGNFKNLILKGISTMRVIVTKDYEELGRVAANIIAAQVTLKPESVLGLATGSSPISTYQNLIKKSR